MTIGILTLPLHTNYGGILQAYALQTVLQRMGHEVCLLEEEHNLRLPLWKAPIVYGKRILKNILGIPCPIFYEKKLERESLIIRQNTNQFISKYIDVRKVKSFHDIKKNDYDAIIVGSDQIWRPKYFPKIEHAFLDFANGWDIKRIAYAASFGTDEWEYSQNQTSVCARSAKLFDAISVREVSAVNLCKRYLGVKAQQVLDPTMLLCREDYIKLFEAANMPKSSGTLLCYILDETPEISAYIEQFVKDKGLVPFRVNSKAENHKAPLAERIQPPVEQWLRGFYDAEYVITDSFHACVFSILFNKPFIALGNEKRGMSRFHSLLSMCGLEGRMMQSIQSGFIGEEIDWDKVNYELDIHRREARAFMKEHIG